MYAYILVYGAAGLSFLATLVRDYVIIKYSIDSAVFFQLFYTASLAAGFSVNAITLGNRISRKAIVFLIVCSICVAFIAIPREISSVGRMSWVCAVLGLWILGSMWSRIAIENNMFFLGRSREAVTSVAMAGLVAIGIYVEPAFIYAVLIGTIFSWAIYKRVDKKPEEKDEASFGTDKNWPKKYQNLFNNIFLSNVSSFVITWWALRNTDPTIQMYGYESTIIVRLSLYTYQAITIGAVVFIARKVMPISTILASRMGLLSAMVALMSLAFSPAAQVIVIPLSLGLVHYCSVIYLQASS